jgi:hypothetical protein
MSTTWGKKHTMAINLTTDERKIKIKNHLNSLNMLVSDLKSTATAHCTDEQITH